MWGRVAVTWDAGRVPELPSADLGCTAPPHTLGTFVTGDCAPRRAQPAGPQQRNSHLLIPGGSGGSKLPN